MNTQVVAIICMVVFLISTFKERNIMNPTSFFSIIWGIVFALYSINPYYLPMANEKNVNIIIAGVFCFFVGTFLLGDVLIKNRKVYKRVRVCSIHNKVIYNNIGNSKIIWALCIMGSIIYLYLSFPGIRAIMSGKNMWHIRYVMREDLLNTGINGMLLTYVASPIMYFNLAYSITTVNELIKTKKGKLYLILSVFMGVAEYLTTGGRLVLLYALVCILCTISMNPQKKKMIMFFGIIVIVLVFFIFKAVIDRGGDILKSTIIYIYAPIQASDIYIDYFNSQQYSFTYGLLSLQGITRIFFKVLGLANIGLIQNVDRVYELIDSPIYIGSMRFNSSATFVGYFYFDFGIMGVILGSILFGVIAHRYYRYVFQKEITSLSNVILYVILMGVISFSFISFTIASTGYALAIFIVLVLRNKKIKLEG